jgi:hypothetical protein
LAAAAKTMREQYETVLASIGEMLASSNRNFGQTAQEMRATAEQVVHDIDHARSELKRTILELPDETRANADAMRRVVSDQITALSALSDVVKRQSGLMEMSGPGVHLSPGNGGPSPGKSEGAPSTAPQTRTAGAQDKVSQRSTGEEPGDGATVHSRPIKVLVKAPALPGSEHTVLNLTVRTPEATIPGGEDAGSAGLARRTDRLVARLNAVARHLVEALDGKLDEELERRFSAGEEHVYTNRLYLARGKLQAEIKARYGQEQQVRGRTDGFVTLFERLLDRVAEAPEGQELVDACLSSESGRVYLMLAQASGRDAEE